MRHDGVVHNYEKAEYRFRPADLRFPFGELGSFGQRLDVIAAGDGLGLFGDDGQLPLDGPQAGLMGDDQLAFLGKRVVVEIPIDARQFLQPGVEKIAVLDIAVHENFLISVY